MSEETALEVLPPLQPGPPAQKLKPATTLPNLWRVFVGLKGDLAPNTLSHYDIIGKRFCKFFKNRELTPQTMTQWLMFLREIRKGGKRDVKIGAYRINHLNHRIKGFLHFLHRQGFIYTPLWECIPTLPEEPRKPAQIITEQEYEAIKAYMKDRDRFQAQLWLCILGYRTGMSLVDCCHLRWKDVHLDENGPSYMDIRRWKIRRHGDKAMCQIPIVPNTDLYQWLLKLRKVDNYKRHDGITDYVQQDCPGLYAANRLTGMSGLDRDFRHVFSKAGIEPDKTFRHFRNSLCSALVNSGMQLALVCKITGHTNVKTLLRYLKPDRQALQDGMLNAQQYAEAQAGNQTKTESPL